MLVKTGPGEAASTAEEAARAIVETVVHGDLWARTVKRTVARFARGNIAVQNCRVLMPEEQSLEHERSVKIAREWRDRYKRLSADK